MCACVCACVRVFGVLCACVCACVRVFGVLCACVCAVCVYIVALPRVPHTMTTQLTSENTYMGWLRLVGSLKLKVSVAKVPYKRDDILQKRPVILRSLLIVADV